MNKAPLAERMRPKRIDDFAGQKHLIGEGKILKRLLEGNETPSIIFWGPPGVGKTTLAILLAREWKLPLIELSAISAGVKEVRASIQTAKKAGKITLFIDEIHRFNKSQQDALLGAVEKGQIVLIGATTENPSFEVISALLSRCQVLTLQDLVKEELLEILNKAVTTDSLLSSKKIKIDNVDLLLQLSGGDARKLLNHFELIIGSEKQDEIVVNNELIEKYLVSKASRYDKSGEQHYDIISAFIKSIRGSDPDASLYWLARMIKGGEDPKFIARRLLIAASEDIGNANPTALVLANSCFEAVNKLGYPECSLVLAQATVYLASSPKSNASYTALKRALKFVDESGDLAVPLHLRNAPTKLMKDLNYAKHYLYPHDYEGNFVEQQYMPEGKDVFFYNAGSNAKEQLNKKRIHTLWKDRYKDHYKK